ncbi:MAG: dicarboxylate/amino acid:cation symporter [Scytonematopsis contorta HA4267-MV1]|jgi:Na+/H+-dicarboxylate symporter|nr:dicarboxylate/amino acid:cation symporter [Scytonematopsis contorta HA4267-MV1]
MNNQNRPWWQRIGLTLQILIALVLAVIVGSLLKGSSEDFIDKLVLPSTLVFQAMQALAIPLVFVVSVSNLFTGKVFRRGNLHLLPSLFINTTIAAVIGLLITQLTHPGIVEQLPGAVKESYSKCVNINGWLDIIKNLVPETSLLQSFAENNVIQIMVISLCLGIAFQTIREEEIKKITEQELEKEDSTFLALDRVLKFSKEVAVRILGWVIALLPLAVFGFVTQMIARNEFAKFQSLVFYVLAVLFALLLQICYYLIRLKISSRVGVKTFLMKGKDTFLTAFGTASSNVTANRANEVLQSMGLRKSSAVLGGFVVQRINKDGTALHLVMTALYVSQLQGLDLNIPQLFLVVVTSIFVSTSTAGIPSAGLVTMTLVFSSVCLNSDYIALISTVYWALDSSCTVVNVMGNMTFAALVDAKQKVSHS